MSATLRPTVAAHRDQANRLTGLVAELKRRKWNAYLAATLPNKPPRMVVQHRKNKAVSEHILAAPDATTGIWWYWRETEEPVAPADAPGAAANAIIDALTPRDAPGGAAGRQRPSPSQGSRSRRVPAAGGGRDRSVAAAMPGGRFRRGQ